MPLTAPETDRASRGHFWTYWAASTTSSVGSAVTSVALPLTAVLVLGATEFQMGLLAAAEYVAWLVIGLPAGAIVRRLPLRGVQVGMDLIRAAAIASIPLVWWLHALTLTQLLLVALTISFADVLFFVANATFLPHVVPREQLQARNSLMSATSAGSSLGGPSLGGLLVATLGAVPALLTDGLSYLVSGVLLSRLPARTQPPDDRSVSIRSQIREGWRFVIEHPIMRPCLWAATSTNFINGAWYALFTVYLVRTVGAPTGLVGVLLAADGLGSLIFAASTPWLVQRFGSARACVGGAAVTVVGAFVLPLGTGGTALACFAVGNLVFSGGVVVLSTTTRTYRQLATPPELLSRVLATVRFISWGAIPVGGVVAGAVGAWLGARGALFLFAGLTVLTPLVLLRSPLRHLRDFPDAAA